MRSPGCLALVLVAALAAPALAESPRSDDPGKSLTRGKPSAPVTLTLTLASDGGGGSRVILDVMVVRDVPAVELRLAGRTARFGATRAGQHRRLEAPIVVPATGDDVIGSARVGAPGRIRSRVATLRVGPPAAAAKQRPYRTVIVGGRAVAEVRE